MQYIQTNVYVFKYTHLHISPQSEHSGTNPHIPKHVNTHTPTYINTMSTFQHLYIWIYIRIIIYIHTFTPTHHAQTCNNDQ